ncbi:hypothetical protein, partial [Chromohalobacter sp. 296-RDG]|uniref:hypothetical protein n=1 Tax=Chromohalobacter sp. 296-RDG TaxID=2994062 RepID=UPI002468EEDD
TAPMAAMNGFMAAKRGAPKQEGIRRARNIEKNGATKKQTSFVVDTFRVGYIIAVQNPYLQVIPNPVIGQIASNCIKEFAEYK